MDGEVSGVVEPAVNSLEEIEEQPEQFLIPEQQLVTEQQDR